MAVSQDVESLLTRIQKLRAELDRAESEWRALRQGMGEEQSYFQEDGDPLFQIAGPEHPYRVITEIMEEGAAAFWADGTILYCNQQFVRMLAVSRRDIIGADFFELIHPKDKDRWRRDWEAVESGAARVIDTEIAIGYDEIWIPMRVKCRPAEFHQSGKPLLLMATCLDLSKIKESEEESDRSRNDFPAVMETLPVAVCEADFSEARAERLQQHESGEESDRDPAEITILEAIPRMLDMNRAAVELFGASNKHELMSRDREIFIPDDPGFISQIRVMAGGAAFGRGEMTLRKPDGSPLRVFATWSAAPGREATLDRVRLCLSNVSQAAGSEEACVGDRCPHKMLARVFPDPVIIQDAQGGIEYANQAAEALLGGELETLTGMQPVDFLPADLTPKRIQAQEHVQGTGAAALIEEKFRSPQGDTWFDTTLFPFPDSSGVRIVGVSGNITDRKGIEQRLRDRSAEVVALKRRCDALYRLSKIMRADIPLEKLYQPIVEIVSHTVDFPMIAIELCMAGRNTWVFAFGKGFDAPPGEVTAAESLGGFTARTGKMWAGGRASARGEQLYDMLRRRAIETFLCAPLSDGERVFGAFSLGHPEKRELAPDMILWVKTLANCISALISKKHAESSWKENDEKYRSLCSSMNEGMALCTLILDDKGKPCDYVVDDVNPAFERLTGIDRGFVVGRRVSETFGTAPRLEECARTVETGEPYHMDAPVPGSERRVRVTVFPQGKGRFAAIFSDAPDHTRSEEAQTCGRQFETLGDFSSGRAHRLNNLLQLCGARAQFGLASLERDDIDEARARFNQILEGSGMGTSTSKRLPDFDASETGRVQEKPGVVDLSHVVRRALEIAEHLRNQQSPDGSTVEFDTDLGEGCLVDGYETELFEVLAEALKSATEALTEGGRISLVSKADQGRVTLELRLNRAGASAEDPDREFDTFRNLEDAETGFAASRRVVERHGGTISAARGALGGSERRVVELPLSAQAGGPGNPAADREIVILLVDDVPAIVNIFEMGLKKYNQRTLVAHSAEDALKLYTENHVDAIVSDLVMPEINGAQFAGEVKRICEEKQRPKTPFILVTGWGGDERDEQGFADAGIDAVMEKPIDMARLMDTLTELLRPT